MENNFKFLTTKKCLVCDNHLRMGDWTKEEYYENYHNWSEEQKQNHKDIIDGYDWYKNRMEKMFGIEKTNLFLTYPEVENWKQVCKACIESEKIMGEVDFEKTLPY
jgi:hypothetical protein